MIPTRRWCACEAALFVVVVLALSTPPVALANDNETVETVAEDNEQTQVRPNVADRSHRFLSSRFDTLAERLDQYFGSPRYDLEKAASIVRLRQSYAWDESRDDIHKTSVRGKLRLPNLEQRLNLIFSGDSDEDGEDDINDTRDVGNSLPNNDRGVDLQFIDETSKRHQLEFRAGIRSGFKARLSARYRYSLALTERWAIRFSEEPEWLDTEGFKLITRFDTGYTLSDTSHLRWENRLDYGEKTLGVEWRSVLSSRNVIDDQSAVSFYLSSNGRTRPGYLTREYAIGSIYRVNIWRKWLFVELEPAYRWRRDLASDNREGAATVIARLEVVFSEDHVD